MFVRGEGGGEIKFNSEINEQLFVIMGNIGTMLCKRITLFM